MAPEQAEGRDAGEAADMYSLALVLYEALSGRNPVRGATPAETARRIGQRVPSVAHARVGLGKDLVDAIDRALLGRPRSRGTLSELAAALAAAHRASVDEHAGQTVTRRAHPGARRPRAPDARTAVYDDV